MSEDVCSCAHNFNFLANNSNAALRQLFEIFTKLPVASVPSSADLSGLAMHATGHAVEH
jgi:hypothetical protein